MAKSQAMWMPSAHQVEIVVAWSRRSNNLMVTAFFNIPDLARCVYRVAGLAWSKIHHDFSPSPEINALLDDLSK